MKIIKTQQIAGYKTEIRLKTNGGDIIKYFSSTSGVDQEQADQNVYKRLVYFCSRCIAHLEGKNMYIEDHIKQKIKASKTTKADFEQVIKKIKPLIVGVEVKRKEIEL